MPQPAQVEGSVVTGVYFGGGDIIYNPVPQQVLAETESLAGGHFMIRVYASATKACRINVQRVKNGSPYRQFELPVNPDKYTEFTIPMTTEISDGETFRTIFVEGNGVSRVSVIMLLMRLPKPLYGT